MHCSTRLCYYSPHPLLYLRTCFLTLHNFILIDFQCDSDEVFEYVMSRGYIIRSGKALGFPTSVRITVGTHDQNIGVIAAMEDFLQNKARS